MLTVNLSRKDDTSTCEVSILGDVWCWGTIRLSLDYSSIIIIDTEELRYLDDFTAILRPNVVMYEEVISAVHLFDILIIFRHCQLYGVSSVALLLLLWLQV